MTTTYGGSKAICGKQRQGLSFLANALLNRKIFKLELDKKPFSTEEINDIIHRVATKFNLDINHAKNLVFHGSETNEMYNSQKDEIMVLLKNNTIQPFSSVSDYPMGNTIVIKYFLCFPKL
jgi:hypothetical protein